MENQQEKSKTRRDVIVPFRTRTATPPRAARDIAKKIEKLIRKPGPGNDAA